MNQRVLTRIEDELGEKGKSEEGRRDALRFEIDMGLSRRVEI